MMGSRKEEERNEKIIRGLLKLPPNRRCINCNSLGPQYVCTNFWTFVCMTCSGIHREFTHRVKSVSMSKFTVQEVEALQNGGNQRAKETYLRDWDYERQRLPASSNVDRVREFIKHVYVDKKYAGTKPADKPPRDLQRMGSYEDESRRASSYHSFSQSPPYDFQYEERRYGKQGAVLARRPGSDRGIYAGKMSNFVFSPTRSNDRMSEDRFANEGSVSRLSDYSVSSGGDLGRPGSGVGSPNFQKESGASSPSPQPLGGVNNQIAQPQRTMSLGTKSFFGKPFAVRSNSLPTLVDELSEPEQSALPYKENGPVLFPPTSAIHNNMGFAKPPALPQSDSAPIDLFQLPSSSGPPLDLFNVSQPQPPSKKMDRHPQTFPPTLDLFSGFDQNQPVVTAGKISPKPVAPKNEGWATFDNMQPVASTAGAEKSAHSLMANGSDLAAAQGGQVSTLGTQMELQAFQNVGAEKTSSVVDPWHADLHNPELQSISTTQAWNVFDNSSVPFPVEHVHPFSESKLPAYNHSAGLDMHIGQPDNDATRRDAYFQPSALRSSSHPEHPMMEQRVSQAPHSRSTNPFELPFDSELEADKMFLDMTSLQSALPNDHLPSTFLADASQSWFPQDPVMNYMPSVAPQGGLPYAPGQVLSPPLGSIPAQGPVASIGGNPFA